MRCAKFGFLVVAVGLFSAFFGLSSASATPVTYAFTFDGTLNNAYGSLGGDLNVGAGQSLNLTVRYTYDGNPQLMTATEATFFLTHLKILDNTNGLSSDRLEVPTGTSFMTLRYNNPLDTISGVTFGGAPAGGFIISSIPVPGGTTPLFMGEFGDSGDPLPGGAAFDALVNGMFQIQLIARGPNINDDIVGGFLNPGSFQLMSVVPEPAMSMSALALVGLVALRRRRRRCPQAKAFV